MAGGVFVKHDKVRPGAYINYVAIKGAESISTATSGVVAISGLLQLEWADKGLIELERRDLLNGGITTKTGLTPSDLGYYIIRETLRNSVKVIMRAVTSGSPAAALTGKVMADKTGGLGNSIIITYDNTSKLLTTVFNKNVVDIQEGVDKVSDYAANGYWKFSSTTQGTDSVSTIFTSNNPVPLTGGTSVSLTLPLLSDKFTVLLSNDTSAADFIKLLREEEGIRVYGVLTGITGIGPDYEGVSVVTNGYNLPEFDTVYPDLKSDSPFLGAAYFAGLSSSSQPTQSNTYARLPAGVSLSSPLSNSEIEGLLKSGKIVFSQTRDGGVVIEQDINSLVTYDETRKYEFSKNRVLRTIDFIADSVQDIFESSYIGKVANNDTGRSLLKEAITKILRSLQDSEGIKNLDPENDVEVLQGETIDSVIVNIYVQPVDAMEKLYMTIYVS
jgi:hypothetical protein